MKAEHVPIISLDVGLERLVGTVVRILHGYDDYLFVESLSSVISQ
jgi:hypothetical protein